MTTIVQPTVHSPVLPQHSTVRARSVGFLADLRSVAHRALLLIPRDVEGVVPALMIPVFFFVVNVGSLQSITEAQAPDFDYKARPSTQLEIPLRDRIAEIRKRKAEERARSAAKAARRGASLRGQSPAPAREPGHTDRRPPGSAARRHRRRPPRRPGR